MQQVPIGERVYFFCKTRSPTTGASADATGTVTWAAYQQNNSVAVDSGNMTKRSTGQYYGDTLATEANYDAGKWYEVVATATVGGVSDNATVAYFRCTLAENVDSIPVVDVQYLDGQSVTAAGAVTVNSEVGASATAMDAFEDQYDGTGLSGSTYPATQDQLNNVGAAAGGSINIEVTEDNTSAPIDPSSTAFVGNVTGGTTFANTEAENGLTHDIEDTTDVITLVYGFDVGNSRTATAVNIIADVTSNADEIAVKAYDHVGSGWDVIGTITGSGGFITIDKPLLLKHTGTGSELGKVYIAFDTDSTTPATLSIELALVSAVTIVTGIPNGSTVTLASSTVNENLVGRAWTLALGGQDITGSYIFQATDVSGIGTGTNGTYYYFQECILNTCTLDAYGVLAGCGLANTITLASTGGVTADEFYVGNCSSAVPGSGSPHLDASGVTKATNISFRRWSGGLTLTLTSDCTVSVDAVSGGTITVNGIGGTLNVRGTLEGITDNSGEAVTITQNALINSDNTNTLVTRVGEPTSDLSTEIATIDANVDVIHAQTLVAIPNSLTDIKDTQDSLIANTGTAQAGAASTITLATGASTTDDLYNAMAIAISSGTGAGQSNKITDYVGSTRVATVQDAWVTQPDNTSVYTVLGRV